MTRRPSKYSFLVAVCVMVLPGLLPAHAEGDATNARFLMPIVQVVEDMAQEENESRHDFLARVATRMMAFTEFSGFEVSARLCQDSAGMQATKLLTWRAHFSAPAMQVCPPFPPLPDPGVYPHPPAWRNL